MDASYKPFKNTTLTYLVKDASEKKKSKHIAKKYKCTTIPQP